MTGNTITLRLSEGERDRLQANLLNKELRLFFQNAARITLSDPRQALFFLRTVGWQARAARTRARWKRQGVHVPPIVIFSITFRTRRRSGPSTGCNARPTCIAPGSHLLTTAHSGRIMSLPEN
jgi:hypothetical protein